MKGYLLSPAALADEARILESNGVDAVIIMDSAGTMRPDAVMEYVTELKAAVRIPVGFHGHNNLGFSVANTAAAAKAGADILDCCLLGMARSAGNTPTELAAATALNGPESLSVDFYGLLDFLDQRLIPAMENHGYHTSLKPLELILGYCGCHSSFVPLFRKISEETGTGLFRLIVETSAANRKDPDEELIRQKAAQIISAKGI